MQTLTEIGKKTSGHSKLSGEWQPVDLLPIYEPYFINLYDKPIKLLEIGVGDGGSLQIWKEYFIHRDREIHEIDIRPATISYQDIENKIFIHIGSQNNEGFLSNISQYGPFDIIIDDGSHMQYDQKFSLNRLWASVKGGGFYIIEDTCCSYWPNRFGDKGQDSTIEFIKKLVDDIHKPYIGNESIPYEVYKNIEKSINYILPNLYSIHFYNGSVILRKK